MTTEVETATDPKSYRVPSIVLAAVFGVLYAYVLWQAISDLIALPTILGSLTPWWLLIGDVAVPVVAFVAAVLVGRRASFLGRGLFLLIGLTVVSALTVSSFAYVQTH